jgi:hypothetical protein
VKGVTLYNATPAGFRRRIFRMKRLNEFMDLA